MMIPRRNFFDEVFNDENLMDKREAKIMKTDIKEKDGNYIFTVDVPGFEKENIEIELENGYLTVSAKTNKEINNEEKDGNYIYRERYSGQCSRSFYVGDNVTEEDIKASFKNGVLTMVVPENKPQQEEQKKRIIID